MEYSLLSVDFFFFPRPASKFHLCCSRCLTDKDQSEVQLPASQGLSVQEEVVECSQNIIHPSPGPVSTKSLIHYTVKLCATSFLTPEVSELKIRSLQIFKFHSCITKPTQPHWKEMHKERHCGGWGGAETFGRNLSPKYALVRNQYKEGIKFSLSHM